jgi:hypothetical protein
MYIIEEFLYLACIIDQSVELPRQLVGLYLNMCSSCHSGHKLG